jgi:uncharacterized protein YkwD
MGRAAVLLTAVLVLAVGATSAEARRSAAVRAVEANINSVRAEHGCGPLRVHAGLTRVADRQAHLLLAEGRLSHDAGTPFAQRVPEAAPAAQIFGEDLAWGSGPLALPASIVEAWMNSPPHRDVLLDCRFSLVGIGAASGRFGENPHATVYTADLAG